MPVYDVDQVGGQLMHPHGPEDDLTYTIDLAAKTNGTGAKDWLDTANGEEISGTPVITPPSGISADLVGVINSNTAIKVRVYYASAIAAGEYPITVAFATNSTPAHEKTITMIVPVEDR